MRPIKLTMTAFGPYAKTQTVDFREAIDAGVFGIYGETGSGKSTIFSAITFALFGEPARSDQEAESVRSHHAAADLQTSVELIFEVGAARYLIRRHPLQMRPSKRGEGEVKLPHQAWLFDITGIEPDDITEENTGKKIQEKKVSLVRDAIHDLLGYGLTQFTQIVLLPQGKFETFLTAKSDDRKKILRDLFDVSLYRDLAETLKAEAHEVEQTVKIDRQSCANRLAQEEFESPDALSAGIAEAIKNAGVSQTAATKAEEAAKKSNAALQSAKLVEGEFVAKEQAHSLLQDLLKRADEMAASETGLKNAKKAKSLLDVDDAVTQASTALKRLETAQGAAELELEKAKTEHGIADNNHKAQEALSENRKEQSRTVDALRAHVQTLKNSTADKIAWSEAQTAEQGVLADATKSKSDLEGFQRVHAAKQAELEKARLGSVERSDLQTKLLAAKQQFTSAQAYEAAKSEAKVSHDLLVEQNSKAEATKRELGDANLVFTKAEADLSAVQAIHLATKLVAGDPCSVCGSHEHPAPAIGSTESANRERAFQDAKHSLEIKRQANGTALEELAAIRARADERNAQLSLLEIPHQTAQEVRGTVQTLNNAIIALGADEDLDKLGVEIEGLTQQIKAAQTKEIELNEAYQTAKTTTALAKQKYETALEAVPEHLRTEDALEIAVRDAETTLAAMLLDWKTAQETLTKASEAKLGADKDLQAAKTAYGQALAHLQRAESTFAERLEKEAFTRDLFEFNKTKIAGIAELEKTIASYKEGVAVAKDRVTTTTKAIEGKSRPILSEYTKAYGEAEEIQKAAATEVAERQARTTHLENLLASIARELAAIKKMEDSSKDLRELASLFNAGNPAKLDLETFAIGAMFDRVLQAANLRLDPMTEGRYTLLREMEGKGSARRGLGISVHDIHTGSARATSTLSGGETFKAALALALGLSDIVESANGSIRLDTIFIDEGFGSLDAQSLQNVLETLGDVLGQHRTVGLISHVDMVKEAIPNGFNVTSTRKGSRVEQRWA